jgi:hypothetical protein
MKISCCIFIVAQYQRSSFSCIPNSFARVRNRIKKHRIQPYKRSEIEQAAPRSHDYEWQTITSNSSFT